MEYNFRIPSFNMSECLFIFFHGQRNKEIILMVDVNNKIILSDGKHITEKSVDCPVLTCLDI
jgi:hypothetical protein